FGRLSMGDVDSAAEAAVGQVLRGYPGFRNDEWDHVSYVGAAASANNPVALYQYSFGDTTVFASLADGKAGGLNHKVGEDDLLLRTASPSGTYARSGEESFGVGVRHVFGDYTI